jgi:hypothetical protein
MAYDTNRTTGTVAAAKEVVEDKGGKLTIKTATQSVDLSDADKAYLLAQGIVS